MNILKDLGITTENDAVQTLKNNVVDVFDTPSMIFCPQTNKLIETGYRTISNANGNIHGVVSKKGSVLGMDNLIDIAHGVSKNDGLNLNFNKAKLIYFKDEAIVSLNIPLGNASFTNKNGFTDTTKIDLFIKTGFGGNSCTEIGVYSHRFVCSNGMEVRHGLNYFKAKHTELMNVKAQTFLASKLPMMMTAKNDFKAMAKQFDKTLITKDDINNFRNSLFNIKNTEDISTKKQTMLDKFNESLDLEFSRCDQTVWGLLQGATNYTNHNHFNSSKEFIVTGSGATFNATAEKLCLELAK
jgi:hypothetical protein